LIEYSHDSSIHPLAVLTPRVGAGRPSAAADAAEHAQDPDAAAGGARDGRPRRLRPAPPRAQLALGGASAGAGVTRKQTKRRAGLAGGA
jgi:hypothetical protein